MAKTGISSSKKKSIWHQIKNAEAETGLAKKGKMDLSTEAG